MKYSQLSFIMLETIHIEDLIYMQYRAFLRFAIVGVCEWLNQGYIEHRDCSLQRFQFFWWTTEGLF